MARIFKQVVAVRICNRLLLPTETLANVRAKMMLLRSWQESGLVAATISRTVSSLASSSILKG